MAMGIRCAEPHDTLYLLKVALTSPISSDHSVRTVRLRTNTTEFFYAHTRQQSLEMPVLLCLKI
jgi:hypothetical protein